MRLLPGQRTFLNISVDIDTRSDESKKKKLFVEMHFSLKIAFLDGRETHNCMHGHHRQNK